MQDGKQDGKRRVYTHTHTHTHTHGRNRTKYRGARRLPTAQVLGVDEKPITGPRQLIASQTTNLRWGGMGKHRPTRHENEEFGEETSIGRDGAHMGKDTNEPGDWPCHHHHHHRLPNCFPLGLSGRPRAENVPPCSGSVLTLHPPIAVTAVSNIKNQETKMTEE